MNTVVFSIIRLCPPVVPVDSINWRTIRPWGDTAENSPCHGPQAWEGLHATAGVVSLLGSLGAVAGSQLVGGNSDFTDAPAHGGDDARFYDRQQAYVHARAE